MRKSVSKCCSRLRRASANGMRCDKAALFHPVSDRIGTKAALSTKVLKRVWDLIFLYYLI